MKTSGLSRYALLACCLAIAACSQSTELSRLQYTPNLSSIHERLESPLTYGVLYSFGGPDGKSPVAGLIDVRGTLYGTTYLGGAYNYGTVFSITTGGKEKVLHSFGKGCPSACTDGSFPDASLIDVSGTLYGTTEKGGANYGVEGAGTVFSITTGGDEKVLHSFGKGCPSGCTDGSFPEASLIDVSGTLYGTTIAGGMEGTGTVFSIMMDGKEKVLHSFGNTTADGAEPGASLIDVKGTLYGETANGGAYSDGTFFSITTSGKEKVLHSFGKGTDGVSPGGSLIDVSGTLYGIAGGGARLDGTVFSITTSGKEKVLHSFGKGTDGVSPGGSLIDVSGTLYGTTAEGGAYTYYGTVFSITTGGKEKVLHSFGKDCPTACSDGSEPYAGLINVKGTLYGTTTDGGVINAANPGDGTVFSITP